MTDAIKKINNFTPLLSLILTVIAVVVFFVRVDANILEARKKQDAHMILTSTLVSNIEKQNIYLSQLVELAKDAEKNSNDMNVVLGKLAVTLDNINYKLK